MDKSFKEAFRCVNTIIRSVCIHISDKENKGVVERECAHYICNIFWHLAKCADVYRETAKCNSSDYITNIQYSNEPVSISPEELNDLGIYNCEVFITLIQVNITRVSLTRNSSTRIIKCRACFYHSNA